MPRSFLIKKKDKGDRKGDDSLFNLGVVTKPEVDVRPVITEPLLAAVAPYSPYTPLVQPLAVRFCNGKIYCCSYLHLLYKKKVNLSYSN